MEFFFALYKFNNQSINQSLFSQQRQFFSVVYSSLRQGTQVAVNKSLAFYLTVL
jgi:hypothetical protein